MRLVPIVVTLVVLIVSPLAGQEGRGRPWAIAGGLGWLRMDATLRVVAVPGADSAPTLAGVRVEDGIGVGIRVETPLVGSWLALRGGLLVAPARDVVVETSTERIATTPGGLYGASAAFVIRSVQLAGVVPYGVVGGGAKRYSMANNGLTSDLADQLGTAETVASVELGAGAVFRLGQVSAFVELTDLFSRTNPPPVEVMAPDGELTLINAGSDSHDVFFLVGMRVESGR